MESLVVQLLRTIKRATPLKRATACKRNPVLKPAKLLHHFSKKVLGSMGLADNIFVVLGKL
jgi:hypothetical protein